MAEQEVASAASAATAAGPEDTYAAAEEQYQRCGWHELVVVQEAETSTVVPAAVVAQWVHSLRPLLQPHSLTGCCLLPHSAAAVLLFHRSALCPLLFAAVFVFSPILNFYFPFRQCPDAASHLGTAARSLSGSWSGAGCRGDRQIY